MNWEPILLKIMGFILRGMALVLGSVSILLLWASFHDPRGGGLAFITLLTATLITLGLPQPSATPSHGRR
jgi:hypothetical protein